MALVKDAIIRLRVEEFQKAETSARGLANETQRAAVATERVSAAARTAGMSMQSALSKVGTAAALIGGTLGGLSDNPLLRGVSQVFQGAGIGAAFGGPVGALAGGAIAAASALSGAGSAAPAKIENHINVPLQDGDIRRAAEHARRAVVEAMERRIFDLQNQLGQAGRLDREADYVRLPR